MDMARIIEAAIPKTANPAATQNPNLISFAACEAMPYVPYGVYEPDYPDE
jgi:hypothetical protein